MCSRNLLGLKASGHLRPLSRQPLTGTTLLARPNLTFTSFRYESTSSRRRAKPTIPTTNLNLQAVLSQARQDRPSQLSKITSPRPTGVPRPRYRNRKTGKTWYKAGVQKLQSNALGSPAEVLVLEGRKDEPNTVTTDEEATELPEEEIAPTLSADETLEDGERSKSKIQTTSQSSNPAYIDGIDSLRPLNSTLSLRQYEDLHSQLRTQFTAMQFQKYLDLKGTPDAILRVPSWQWGRVDLALDGTLGQDGGVVTRNKQPRRDLLSSILKDAGP